MYLLVFVIAINSATGLPAPIIAEVTKHETFDLCEKKGAELVLKMKTDSYSWLCKKL